ncbi:hypothetical protein FB381_0072 [Nocardioides albertanoniae]|uniref:Uncharacterized protein n=1 Tax=Nocardioides albertanoniae TaxID=1175486 RepID=A0A543A0V2_9ACTN|nr:hypothetical protein [Nocardioides albertanoniae]TQL66223.1 hypothetical protein FB381_0072 [Nocardioides albertanoniae]
MATPLSELLPQIVTLNVPDQPFSYFAQGDQIIGWWDIAKVTSLYPTQVTHADESYRLTVTLDERNGTFDYNDFRRSSNWKAGATSDGFKIGGEMEWHSGQRTEKSWTFQLGGLNRSSVGGSEPEVGTGPVVYSFETSRIKEPLFGWLQSHGWQHKGVLGKFFAR